MYIDFTLLDDIVLSLPEKSQPQTELQKAIEIREQLSHSIEWLKFEATQEKDYDKKSTLLKEVAAAEQEHSRIDKQIRKVL